MPETMREELVSKGAVIAASLWVVSGVMLAITWVLAVLGLILPGAAVAVTAIASVSVAAVWQIKLYTIRVCALIRSTYGLQSQRTPASERHLERVQ